jgi:hypothetical protein
MLPMFATRAGIRPSAMLPMFTARPSVGCGRGRLQEAAGGTRKIIVISAGSVPSLA